MKTKRVGNEDLPARCFAYVPDPDKPSTWKLPIYKKDGSVDRERLPKAYAAVFSNYRGEKADIPKSALPGVVRKLKAAYRKAGMKWPKEKGSESLLAEGEILNLVEADKDKEPGLAWEVRLIKAGLSANGNYYSGEVLRQAAPLFEGAVALARSDDDHSWNSNVSVANTIGWYSQVRFENGGLYAQLNLLESGRWLHDKLVEARTRGKRDLFGLSIVALGQFTLRKRNSQTVRQVDKIERVISVDPVVFPSAGGRMTALIAASEKEKEGELEMFDKLLQVIEATRPDLLEGKDLENITETELAELYEAALASEPKSEEKPKSAPQEKSGPGTDFLAEAQAKIQEAEQRVKLMECRLLLREKLAESNLPEIAQARLRKIFADRVFEESELVSAIKEEKDYLAQLHQTPVREAGSGIEEVLAERDKLIKSLDGFFFDEDLRIGDQKVPRFRSIREAYITITGDRNLTGQLSEAASLRRFTEAVDSTTWAQILGDSITRRMIAEYNLPQLQDWRKVISDITPITDFRTNRRMRMGGYGVLPAVSESGNYTELTSPGDEEATYSISKRGGLETVTLEAIANDDVGAIRRIPIKLGRAAARTLYKFIFDMFIANSGQGVVCTYDDTELFKSDNSHGNYATTALSAAALTAVRTAMRSQAAYGDTYEILGPALLPKYLLVPNELEELAFKLCTAPVTLISAGTTEVSDMPNIHKGMEPIVVDYWTDANNWYVVCDPKSFPTFEIGFFMGREEPELFLQDAPTVGSMFTADKLTYKIRHIYGGTVLDHRGMAGRIVS